MKKELSLLLQFLLIVLLVGFGLFGIVVLLDKTMLSFWDEYRNPFTNWIMTFLALGSIRLVLINLTANPSIIAPNSKNRNYFAGKEIWITAQYLVIALVSIVFSFYIPVVLAPTHISLNLVEMWLGLRETFLFWFLGFLILSFIRIGIIYIKQNKYRTYLS